MNDAASIGTYFPSALAPQCLADVAVVMPTILRPQILRAVRSVFAQSGPLKVMLLIGIDQAEGEREPLVSLLEARPSWLSALLLNLPYSTSARNGGVHTPLDGGALRSILSFMANSRYVAYLDDDNEWLPHHLELSLAAVRGCAWVQSPRILVDEQTERDICIDRWDSVGVDRGRFAHLGGFVDPNCLLIDKAWVGDALGSWANPFRKRPKDATWEQTHAADKSLFRAIRSEPGGIVREPTVRYRIRRSNVLWTFIRQANRDDGN